MTNIEALDIVFDFLPINILEKLKKEGLYNPILNGSIKEGSELYDFLSKEHAAIQDADYSFLANELASYLKKGTLLQIACGRGDLLFRLADFGFSFLAGIDRSENMLEKAKERLSKYDNVKLIKSKIEDFDFSDLPKIDNVIINNFWGMLDEKNSINLLNKLKKCLNNDSIVIIGDYNEKEKTKERKLADEVLKQNLNFVFAYPFFKDFSKCGYSSKLIKINNENFFILNS